MPKKQTEAARLRQDNQWLRAQLREKDEELRAIKRQRAEALDVLQTMKDDLRAATAVSGLTRLGFVAAVVIACVLATDCSCKGRAGIAHAQGNDLEVHALARLAVHEAGWNSYTHGDIGGIRDVIVATQARLGRKWQRPVTFYEAARAYSGRVFDTTRTDDRRWVPHLRLDGERPKHWPPNLRWDRHAPLWANTLARARELVAGAPSRCEEPPDHWGARYGIDLERAERGEWIEVHCGNSRNAFWKVRR